MSTFALEKCLLLVALWCIIPIQGIKSADLQTNGKHQADKRSEKIIPTDFSSNPLLRTKRAEIDLQTCIGNFNVHRDKIIRTKDSQAMGAKYLKKIDLGSKEDCLRLCCETEDCDVFVFEEKDSYRCYFFHCGPPEDFKCKFTRHVNYSSAVLSINRRLPDLERKLELQSTEGLRMVPEGIKPAPTATTLSPIITKDILPLEKQARKCSRHQFECRSTGDCIALYNVCDGILHCADGSDEAHELGCPAPEAVASVAAQTTSPPKVAGAQTAVVQQYGGEGKLHQAANPLLRTKRALIDLQTCIDNFNVHRDKIIRTQDSQNMGAKYLNEIDLGSREECLRLCCETEDCDVFVFEEKNSGSCYLFHCGPPEDFKCKFTHHVNYSSAVLSINRHLPDLESQIKLTKHVQDLSKLRKPELQSTEILRLVPMVPEAIKPAPTTTLSPVITKEILPLEKQIEARKCSRYQFECRSTGDCIAIYNACDGIPQCADGSDEAHELGCPAPEAVASAAAQTASPPTAKVAVQSPVHQVQTAVVQQYGREGELIQQQPKLPTPNNYQTLYHPQVQMSQVPLQSDPDFLRPDVRSSGRNQYEPIVPVPNYVGLPNNWGLSRQQSINQQGIQQVAQMAQYQDASNQMYSHNEKVPHSDGPMSQIQYPEYPGRVSNYYGENYRQPIQQENWPVEEARYPQQQIYHTQENAAPLVPAKTEGTSHVAEPAPQADVKPSDPVLNSKHVQEKLAHDLKHSKDNMEHGSNQKVKTIVDKASHQELYAKLYKMVDDTQDGLSHIPRGAILSLTLGLIITAVMAILIGCRLRVVRRRLRKGGKGYAHDADYLVNGMYL